MPKTVSFSVSVIVKKIISENEMLKPGINRGKGFSKAYAYLYKPDSVKNYQTGLIEDLGPQTLELLELGKLKNPRIFLKTTFYFSGAFFNRDVDNMPKLYLDALKVALQVDDAFIINHDIWKIKVERDDKKESIESHGYILYDE